MSSALTWSSLLTDKDEQTTVTMPPIPDIAVEDEVSSGLTPVSDTSMRTHCRTWSGPEMAVETGLYSEVGTEDRSCIRWGAGSAE